MSAHLSIPNQETINDIVSALSNLRGSAGEYDLVHILRTIHESHSVKVWGHIYVQGMRNDFLLEIDEFNECSVLEWSFAGRDKSEIAKIRGWEGQAWLETSDGAWF